MNQVTLRYETDMGKQVQLDWKESIPFLLDNGETVVVNVFVLLLSYFRFRVYRLSVSKNQDILLHFLDSAFETFGGVPVVKAIEKAKRERNVDKPKLMHNNHGIQYTCDVYWEATGGWKLSYSQKSLFMG